MIILRDLFNDFLTLFKYNVLRIKIREEVFMKLSFNEEIVFSVRCEIDLLNKYFFYGTEEGFEPDIPADVECPMREIRIYIYDRNNGKPVAFIKLYLMESYCGFL